MRKQVKISAGILVLSLIGAASWHQLHLPEAEPVYAGKRLSFWLGAGPAGPAGRANPEEWMGFNDWMHVPDKTPFLIISPFLVSLKSSSPRAELGQTEGAAE